METPRRDRIRESNEWSSSARLSTLAPSIFSCVASQIIHVVNKTRFDLFVNFLVWASVFLADEFLLKTKILGVP